MDALLFYRGVPVRRVVYATPRKFVPIATEQVPGRNNRGLASYSRGYSGPIPQVSLSARLPSSRLSLSCAPSTSRSLTPHSSLVLVCTPLQVRPHPRYEAEHLVPLGAADERPHARRPLPILAERVSDANAPRSLQNLGHHLVVDVLVQQQARRGAGVRATNKQRNTGQGPRE